MNPDEIIKEEVVETPVVEVVVEDTPSIVTPEMVEAFRAHFEGVEVDAATGSLRLWEKGQGTLASELVQKDDATIAIFAPLVEAYFAAKGEPVPETVKLPIVPIPSGFTSSAPESE